MNKYQEALNNVISYLGVARCDYRKSGKAKEDICLIQELVDKATPKKPLLDEILRGIGILSIRDGGVLINGYRCVCPNCMNPSIYDPGCDERFNYCSVCGQAIDWEE